MPPLYARARSIKFFKTHPTLGIPTIPHLREVPNLPKKIGGFSSSFFLGGIPVTGNLRYKVVRN